MISTIKLHLCDAMMPEEEEEEEEEEQEQEQEVLQTSQSIKCRSERHPVSPMLQSSCSKERKAGYLEPHSPYAPSQNFHNFTVPSSLPLAHILPSGLKPKLQIGP